jgi:hypothetical protein
MCDRRKINRGCYLVSDRDLKCIELITGVFPYQETETMQVVATKWIRYVQENWKSEGSQSSNSKILGHLGEIDHNY